MIKKTVRVAGVLAVALALWFIYRSGALERILMTIEKAGFWGPFIFLGVYALACIFFVPFGIFAFSGGMLFGFWKGSALCVLGNGLGSVAAFWIGRYLARRWVEKALARNAYFKRLFGALEQKGWKMVLLARLSQVFPFSIGNYAFGTTRIPGWQYGAVTAAGTLPSALVFAYLGALAGHISLRRSGAWPKMPAEWAMLILGFVAIVALFFFVRRMARKALVEQDPVSRGHIT